MGTKWFDGYDGLLFKKGGYGTVIHKTTDELNEETAKVFRELLAENAELKKTVEEKDYLIEELTFTINRYRVAMKEIKAKIEKL